MFVIMGLIFGGLIFGGAYIRDFRVSCCIPSLHDFRLLHSTMVARCPSTMTILISYIVKTTEEVAITKFQSYRKNIEASTRRNQSKKGEINCTMRLL